MTPFLPGPDPRPIRRILIANRGEIALRVIRACRDLGIAPVAVYAEPDREAPFVRLADAAYALGGRTPAETYLNGARIIEIALRTGADAVHPGYGFLSERADFAQAVQDAGLIWIGPAPDTITRLGDKVAARALAAQVGAPLVAGSAGAVTAAGAQAFAMEHGLPVAIKAVFGGGGRGLRVARTLAEVQDQFAAATREAEAAFGRGECYVEQFLDRPRHVEVQVLGDLQGRIMVVGTRDCSLQRRNQKLVEEAPAPYLVAAQRATLEGAARDICAAAGYSGAGTVEFLLSADGRLSFLEVNTRLQVEHPVTEEVTGIDLVTAMIRVAQGARLKAEAGPEPRGHAIEFRINAEDPARGFLPTPGRVTLWQPPEGPGVRLDSGLGQGGIVAAEFDSLMAKLIIWAPTRDLALARAARALAEFRIEGVASVLPFHRAVLAAPEFRAPDGDFAVHTRWIETDFADRLRDAVPPHPRVTPADPAPLLRLTVEIDGQRHELGLPADMLGRVSAATRIIPAAEPDARDVVAPLQGTLQRWTVEDGSDVTAGQTVAIIEAMKMETAQSAPAAGRLQQTVPAGGPVTAAQILGRIAVADE